MRTALVALLLASCAHAPPTPDFYCPHTCATQRAVWVRTMPDPNDVTRIPWCVCRRGRVMIGTAPLCPPP